jgi:hypothetical protein
VDLGEQQIQLGGGDGGADLRVLQRAHHLDHPVTDRDTQVLEEDKECHPVQITIVADENI